MVMPFAVVASVNGLPAKAVGVPASSEYMDNFAGFALLTEYKKFPVLSTHIATLVAAVANGLPAIGDNAPLPAILRTLKLLVEFPTYRNFPSGDTAKLDGLTAPALKGEPLICERVPVVRFITNTLTLAAPEWLENKNRPSGSIASDVDPAVSANGEPVIAVSAPVNVELAPTVQLNSD